MIKIILVISFLFSLVHLAEAKCNFNCSAKVKLENPELIKNKTFSKNFVYFNKYDEDDLKEPYIVDYNIGSIGSPLCFYNRDQK